MPAMFDAGVFSAILISAFVAPAIAQTPSPLTGTWTLVKRTRSRPTGRRIQNYGPDAQGRLIIDDEGRYSLQIFRQNRPRFASGGKYRGSPDEYREAVHGMSTHYGRLELDAGAHVLAFHIDQSAFPNWEGAVQRRRYELTDGRLSYEVPPAADGTIARSVWRKVD